MADLDAALDAALGFYDESSSPEKENTPMRRSRVGSRVGSRSGSRAGSRVASRMGSARKSPALASRSDFVSPMSGAKAPGSAKRRTASPASPFKVLTNLVDRLDGRGSAAKGGSSLTFNSHKIGGGITGRSKARRTNMAARRKLLSPSDTKTSSFSIITEAGQQREQGGEVSDSIPLSWPVPPPEEPTVQSEEVPAQDESANAAIPEIDGTEQVATDTAPTAAPAAASKVVAKKSSSSSSIFSSGLFYFGAAAIFFALGVAVPMFLLPHLEKQRNSRSSKK